MSSVDSKPTSRIVNFAQLSQRSLVVLGCLFLNPFLDFPLRHTHTHAPRYNEDDHDVCRSGAVLFGVVVVWNIYAMVSLAKIKHAFEQKWAQGALITALSELSVAGFVGALVLGWSYLNHSDYWFGIAVSALVGFVLCATGLFNLSVINNALAPGYDYGFAVVYPPTLLGVVGLIALSVYERQWYVVGLGFVVFAITVAGFRDARAHAIRKPHSF